MCTGRGLCGALDIRFHSMGVVVRILFIGVALLFGSSHAVAQTDADAIVGVWLNQAKDGYVQVYADNGEYFGLIAGAPEDSARRDESKPGEKNLLGMRILKNFSYDGDGLWQGGTVFDPDNEKTYSSKMWLVDENTLKLRGFIGISLLGRTVVWTRIRSDAPGVAQDVLQ